MDPTIPSINNLPTTAVWIKDLYTISSTSEYIFIWLASVLILKPYSLKIGKLKFWVLIMVPNIYLISKFNFYQSVFENILLNTGLLTPVSLFRFLSLFEEITTLFGALVFGIAFWAISKKVSDIRLKKYIQICGIGICFLFLSSQITTLSLLSYPPFGLASITFVSVSGYLLFVGLYHAALITSRDSVVRSLIYKSANEHTRFISEIGASEMKSTIATSIKGIVKKFGNKINEDSMYELNDLEKDVKDYMNAAIQERKKYLIRENARTFSREESPFGRTWEEWVMLWWQWCYSFTLKESPVADLTGEFAPRKQFQEDVWFLAGTFGGQVIRRCTVPHGTAIFFPIINDIISFHTDPQLRTESELKAYARADLDQTKFISANLNGISIPNLHSFRVSSNLFEISIPEKNNNNLWVKTQAISDGFWLFLKPLSPGKHRLEFIGEKLEFDMIKDYQNITDNDLKGLPKFRVAVVYNLEVP